jgi:hypothetical protein
MSTRGSMPRFDDETYTQLVRQWEAVSHTIDLLCEHGPHPDLLTCWWHQGLSFADSWCLEP